MSDAAVAESMAGAEPVLSLIARIKDHKLDPKNLVAEDRRRCVEVLRAEGYAIPEIAQILRRNERTIFRDLDLIRAQNAVAPDPRLPERLVGELFRQTETSMGRLRRIARETGASAMERLMAESAAWKVFRESFEILQSVGYLPRMPTGVVADVYQHLQAEPIAAYEDLAEQARELWEVAQQAGLANPATAARCQEIVAEVERGCLSVKLRKVREELGHEREELEGVEPDKASQTLTSESTSQEKET